MPDLLHDVQDAADAVRQRTDLVPEVALVLGSGLGALADAVEDAVAMATSDLPGFARSTVSGHAGRLVLGTLEGRAVAVLQGRVHLYEGHATHLATRPVRLVRALGAQRLLLTNAAGGITEDMMPGTLMLLRDHLNLAFAHPLTGRGAEVRTHCPMPPYSEAWMGRVEGVALKAGVRLRRGVYAWTMGPSYETKAEIRAFRTIGADAVGMSTVPETIEARALGMEVLGLSTITNRAAGLGGAVLDHAEVLEVGQQVREDLERLVRAVVRETL